MTAATGPTGTPAPQPSDTVEVDVVVVGGGPAGENAAGRVVRGGLSCAVVDVELFGGECSYWACMPSKALLRPVDVLAAARGLPGVPAGPLDVEAVLARRDAFVSGFDDSSQVSWVESLPARALRGRARLAGERLVHVEGPDGRTTAVRARHAVVLATGTSAAVPPVEGLAQAQPWTSRQATSAKEVPARLTVLGGGVVAVEMAQAHRALGAERVVVLERGDRLLGRMEPFAGELVREALEAAGVEVRTGAQVAAVRRAGPGGPVTVELADGTTYDSDEILVAAGRRPRTDDLGLEVVGLEPGRPVEVDDSLRATGVEGGWLYAVGDVNGRNQLTHMGKYQARACGDVIVARALGRPDDAPALRASADHDAVPQVVFTDPQAASVGLTEAAARAAGRDVRCVEHDPAAVAGAALLADDYRGRAKLVVDAADGRVLGATFVGRDVAELLHSATVAVVGGLTLERLWHAVPAYPTVSEVWLRLLEDAGL